MVQLEVKGAVSGENLAVLDVAETATGADIKTALEGSLPPNSSVQLLTSDGEVLGDAETIPTASSGPTVLQVMFLESVDHILTILFDHVKGEDTFDSHGRLGSNDFVERATRAGMDSKEANAFAAVVDREGGFTYSFCDSCCPGIYSEPFTEKHREKVRQLLRAVRASSGA
eukprot:TRINITY_DN74615_c0_g1_i1.p1 TRINITY_DN74615_c0_g1~~TRINITY_DN74615_c0_g1_i1.p1  ORF type:complete len:171 (-),score=30.61 TRINITY_DN74615_c0_g1_i1:27-539(-)